MRLAHRVSGYDFLRAMLLAGFRLTGTTASCALLEKGAVKLVVPRAAVLAEPQIAALLGEADVPPSRFVSLLDRLGSRDTVPALGAHRF